MRQQPETIGDAILLYVQQQHGTQANAAIAWHCSTTMLSEVIRGTRRPTERMLAAIGYRHIEAWLPQSVALPPSALLMSTDGVPAAAPAEPPYALSTGYALAMRVMQSDLYQHLDDQERAECDEFIRRGQGRPCGVAGTVNQQEQQR